MYNAINREVPKPNKYYKCTKKKAEIKKSDEFVRSESVAVFFCCCVGLLRYKSIRQTEYTDSPD